MTEGDFKRKLARLILLRVKKHLDPGVRRALFLVGRAVDATAERWNPSIRLDNRVEINVWRSFKRDGGFQRVTAMYAATGEEEVAACEAFADLAVKVAKLMSEIQEIVDRYNLGLRARSE